MPHFFGFPWSDWCLGFISGGGEGQMAEAVVSYTGLTACPGWTQRSSSASDPEIGHKLEIIVFIKNSRAHKA